MRTPSLALGAARTSISFFCPAPPLAPILQPIGVQAPCREGAVAPSLPAPPCSILQKCTLYMIPTQWIYTSSSYLTRKPAHSPPQCPHAITPQGLTTETAPPSPALPDCCRSPLFAPWLPPPPSHPLLTYAAVPPLFGPGVFLPTSTPARPPPPTDVFHPYLARYKQPDDAFHPSIEGWRPQCAGRPLPFAPCSTPQILLRSSSAPPAPASSTPLPPQPFFPTRPKASRTLLSAQPHLLARAALAGPLHLFCPPAAPPQFLPPLHPALPPDFPFAPSQC